MGLFGKSNKDPKIAVREWTSKLRKEGYQIDRQINSIKREEEKVKRSLKDAAKKGQKDVCNVLAKEIIRSRRAVNRLHTAKAQMNSVQYGMQQQLSTLKVAGSLQKSTEVMKSMQNLIKVPEICATMRDLSREMMKMGLIEEMMEDTMETMEGDEDLEEEAAEEVDKILWEITAGELGKAPAAVKDSLPVAEPEGATAVSDDEEEVEEMQARLEALRS